MGVARRERKEQNAPVAGGRRWGPGQLPAQGGAEGFPPTADPRGRSFWGRPHEGHSPPVPDPTEVLALSSEGGVGNGTVGPGAGHGMTVPRVLQRQVAPRAVTQPPPAPAEHPGQDRGGATSTPLPSAGLYMGAGYSPPPLGMTLWLGPPVSAQRRGVLLPRVSKPPQARGGKAGGHAHPPSHRAASVYR